MSTSINNSEQRKEYVKAARATGSWLGQMKTVLQVREFEPFYTGEPEQAGGDNSAPTPMEYVVAALNGCLAVVVEKVAAAQDFQVDGIEFDSRGLIDTRGVEGTADVSPQFQEVIINVRVQTPESPDRLDALQAEVLRRCPVFNLLNDSGIDLHLDWRIAEAADDAAAAT